MLDGAAIQLLAREIHTTIRQAAACNSDELQSCGKGLMESFDRAMEVTRNLLCVTARGENELALANSFKHQIQLYLPTGSWNVNIACVAGLLPRNTVVSSGQGRCSSAACLTVSQWHTGNACRHCATSVG